MPKKTNIKINNKSYYRITATIGFDSERKRIRKSFYGDSKKTAELKRDIYIAGVNRGLSVDYDKILLSDLFSKWLFIVQKPNISASSFNRYECLYRLYIKTSSIGNLPIISVKSMDIQKVYNSLNSAKANQLHLLVAGFFKYCVKERLILHNPCDSVRVPKRIKDTTKKNCLIKNDLQKLKTAFATNSKLFIYQFALATGMRQGELLALTFCDIKNGFIRINKSVKRVTVIDNAGNRKSKLVTSPPKTQSGYRTIPIMENLEESLRLHLKTEKEKHLKRGLPFSTNDYIFSSTNCITPMRGDHVTARWKKLLLSLNVEYINFHGIRHTFCSLLAEQGIPLKTASVLMGHANINVTAKIYTHVQLSQKVNAIEKLNEVL